MSSLKSALERSKKAWEAKGKPERARAVLRYDGVTVFYREAGANAVVRLADEHLHRWRAIVPKKAEDAGWPRYLLGADGIGAYTSELQGTWYYMSGNVAEAMCGFTGNLAFSKIINAHEAAEWLYDAGFTEAAYKIEPMWEPVDTLPSVGDWCEFGVPPDAVTPFKIARKDGEWAHDTGGPCSRVKRMTDERGRYIRILRRSRARRDAIAEIEGKLKALGDVR